MSLNGFNKHSHYLYDYIRKYASEKSNAIAIIDADAGNYFTWHAFNTGITMIALQLIDDGFQKGDVVISMLSLLPEHIFFEYACFRLGIMFCPLDVRLKEKRHQATICIPAWTARFLIRVN